VRSSCLSCLLVPRRPPDPPPFPYTTLFRSGSTSCPCSAFSLCCSRSPSASTAASVSDRRTPSTSSASSRGSVCCWRPASASVSRSEEHTSELQSRENLVCRLLLEKKHEEVA